MESSRDSEWTSPFRKDVLDGQVALITGGGSGIGLEIARQFGFHGACVSLMGRRSAVLEEAVAVLRAQGVRATYVVGDVRDGKSCEIAVEQTLKAFGGKLDIVVNSAAGNFLSRAQDLTSNGFKTVMEIDAGGTFNICRASFPHLKAAKGSIINISANLHYGATWFQAHASAAKSAIDSLTRSLALEWGPEGVRVNSVAPGPIADTAGMAKLAPTADGSGAQKVGSSVPLGRMGTKTEMGLVCVFLASNAASYVTGSVVVADGGHWLQREPMVPPELVTKLSKKLEGSTKNIGRATYRSKL
ncbi:hypothetical protein BSKO_07603 [Bryopsis sp. KO-2023]|nr:hypothetical protein BSKO_07603 [Bryopsis sp. KO-2023]